MTKLKQILKFLGSESKDREEIIDHFKKEGWTRDSVRSVLAHAVVYNRLINDNNVYKMTPQGKRHLEKQPATKCINKTKKTNTEIILREIEAKGQVHIEDFECWSKLYEDRSDFKLFVRRMGYPKREDRRYLIIEKGVCRLHVNGVGWLEERNQGIPVTRHPGNRKPNYKNQNGQTRPMTAAEVTAPRIKGWYLFDWKKTPQKTAYA